MKHNSLNISRERIEDFLFLEASLLDEWKLDEWLQLLDANCTYQVPSNDSPSSMSSKALFMIADDKRRTEERVVRLKTGMLMLNFHIQERGDLSLMFES